MTPTLAPIVERGTDNTLVVSSQTIAAGSDVQHKNVLGLIEVHSDSLRSFGEVAFETRPGYNNAPVRVALLNEQQSTLVLTFMRNTDKVVAFKVALVRAFFEMARQLAPVSDDDLVGRALQIVQRRNETMAAELEAAAPILDYHRGFIDTDDELRIRTVAANLQVQERGLRDLLIAADWIYCEERSRFSEKEQRVVPMYRYSEKANHKHHFKRVLEHKAPRFGGEVMYSLKVTPAGAAAIHQLIVRVTEQFGSLGSGISELQERKRQRLAAARTQSAPESPLW